MSQFSPQLVAKIKEAVLAALQSFEGSESSHDEMQNVKAPRGSLALMVQLMTAGATERQIDKVFSKRYAGTGRDKDFVQKRIAIYKREATKRIQADLKNVRAPSRRLRRAS